MPTLVDSGTVYSVYCIAKIILLYYYYFFSTLRGRVVCVRWMYSSGDYVAAHVEDTKCLVKKRFKLW